MRFGICCIALLMSIGAGFEPASAELRTFSLPSAEQSWKDVQEGPLSVVRFVEEIDTERFDDAILPIEPAVVVPVPPIDVDMLPDEYSADDPDSLFRFSRHVARFDVVALEQVVLEDRTIEPGDILIPKWNDFPRGVREVQILRLAGIEEIVAFRNVGESHPRPPVGDKFNKALNLTSFGIFETALRVSVRDDKMASMFDADPYTSFERVDRVGQDVTQKWQIYIDMGQYFPVRMMRFYPNPLIGLRVAAYTLYEGVAGTEREIAGLNLEDSAVGSLGFPRFNRIANTFPTFAEIQRVPVNVKDTVAVLFDPPRGLRYARMSFDTELDYDMGEFEIFADGFIPQATYVTKPLPLPSATLGRIFWEEDWIGDPQKSRIILRVQTGTTPEPQVLFRINAFDAEVEWTAEGAIVLDRRPGSKTSGQLIDLNSADFNLDSRDIFSALEPEERAAVRLTRAEYQGLGGNSRSKVEPDLEFWSGVQPVQNGGLINAPSGRPYIQVQVEFYSDDPSASRIVRNLSFEYSTPQITDQITAEIAPAVNVVAGRDTSFALALKVNLKPENDGFNRLQIFTPARIGGVESFVVDRGEGEVQELERVALEEAQTLPGEGEFKEVLLADNQFVIGFPTIKPSGDEGQQEVMLRLGFTGRVIDFRTNFEGNAFLDTLESDASRDYTANGILVTGSEADTLSLFLPQPIEAGDVVDFLETDQLEDRNSLSVIADISTQSEDLVTNLSVAPNPFTPNGDGINDEVLVGYDVQRLLTPRAVHLEFYDLGGRRVKGIDRELSSGGYTQIWDGRDEAGNLVPPGVYLLRLSTEADEAAAGKVRLISVVY